MPEVATYSYKILIIYVMLDMSWILSLHLCISMQQTPTHPIQLVVEDFLFLEELRTIQAFGSIIPIIHPVLFDGRVIIVAS